MIVAADLPPSSECGRESPGACNGVGALHFQSLQRVEFLFDNVQSLGVTKTFSRGPYGVSQLPERRPVTSRYAFRAPTALGR
jgi:hypothetical protein